MNEFDDLDQLEREFGAALRVALRRVAADIPDDASVWSPGPIARFRHVDTDHLDPDEQLVPLNEVTVSASTAPGQTRSRRRLLIAAAAVVVVIGVAGLALAVTNDDDDQSPAPAATVNVAPTTTVATETVSFAVKSANDIPVTFTMPESWGVLDEKMLGLSDAFTSDPAPTPYGPNAQASPPPTTAPPESTVEQPPYIPIPLGAYSNLSRHGAVVQFDSVFNIYLDGCQLLPFDPPVGPTVDDLVTAWANVPELAATAPVDVIVDGYTGQQIELTVPDNAPPCEPPAPQPAPQPPLWMNPFGFFGIWYGADPNTYGGGIWPNNPRQSPNRHFQMLVLDVDGTRLLIAASADPDTPPQDRAALEQLLASIQIG